MKKNRGFTLVEIIVCIFLIAVISTITVIGVKKNNDNKEKEKIIENVKLAADTYFSTNKELQNQIKENDGCITIDFNILKEKGIISKDLVVPDLTNQEKINQMSYDKVLLCEKGLNNEIDGKNITMISNDNLGYDIIWPYVKNTPYGVDLNDITVFKDELSEFYCNTDLYDYNKGTTKTLEYVSYIDENYNKIKYQNYQCGVCNSFDENNECNNVALKEYNTPLFSSSDNGEKTLIYIYINIDNESIPYSKREVYIVNTDSIQLKAENQDRDQTGYVCGNWTKNNVKLSYTNIDNVKNNSTISWENRCNGDESVCLIEVKGDEIFDKNINTTLSIKSFIQGKQIEKAYSCMLRIDKAAPEINVNVDSNKMHITLTDKGSGINGYYISTTNEDKNNITSWQHYSNPFDYDINSGTYYVYAKDKVGNINKKTVSLENYPTVSVEPIDGTISKFKIKVNSNGTLGDIKVQYTFDKRGDHDFYNFDNMLGNKASYEKTMRNTFDKFVSNFKYDSNYTSKINTSSYECNSSSCEIVIDMFDTIKTCGNNYQCKNVIDPEYIDNLVLTYHVLITNNKDSREYKREVKINSKLNLYKLMFNGRYNNYQGFRTYFNDYASIIYYVWISEKVNNNRYHYYDYYLIDFNQEINQFVSHNSSDEKKYYLWDNNKFVYQLGSKHYEYDINTSTNSKISKWSNYKKNNSIKKNIILKNSINFIDINKYSNYNLIDNILDLNCVKSKDCWERYHNENYTKYSVLNNLNDISSDGKNKLLYTYNDESNEYIYYTYIKGHTYNDTSLDDKNWYGLLVFKEKVDVNITSNKILN